MKRIVVTGVITVVLLLLGVWWLALTRGAASNEAAKTKVAEAAPAAPKTPTKSEVIAALDPTLPSLPPLSARALPLRDQIRDATDLRAYYERNKSQPDASGERSYRLAEAIFECTAFTDLPMEDMSRRLAMRKSALENPRRQELFAFMYERCKGFAGNPADVADIVQALHRRAEAANYPPEIARGLRFEAGRRDPDGADQTAITLLSTVPDPDVVHELAQFLNVRNQGSPAWRGVDIAARTVGWGLLECDFGADCGPRSMPVVMTCITLGACDLQRVEEAVAVQGTQATVNNAMRVRETLQRQIAARDWAAVGFTPRLRAP